MYQWNHIEKYFYDMRRAKVQQKVRSKACKFAVKVSSEDLMMLLECLGKWECRENFYDTFRRWQRCLVTEEKFDGFDWLLKSFSITIKIAFPVRFFESDHFYEVNNQALIKLSREFNV